MSCIFGTLIVMMGGLVDGLQMIGFVFLRLLVSTTLLFVLSLNSMQLLSKVNFLRRMRHVNIEAKRAFIARYERLLFPRPGTSIAQTKWWTYRNVTRVTIWGLDHF